MRLIGLISTATLSVLLGISAPAYAQEQSETLSWVVTDWPNNFWTKILRKDREICKPSSQQSHRKTS